MQSAAFTRPLREMQLEEYSLQFHQKSIIILIKLRRILCCTAFSWMVCGGIMSVRESNFWGGIV